MTAKRREVAAITVLAGVNGAGKSSVAGAALRENGGEYFNPDEATRTILAATPALGLDQANSEAWMQGKRLLREAIDQRKSFTFETTLGGNTIVGMLAEAHAAGMIVRVWFVGLEGPELHIARVRARVAAGGHDIPEAKIHERYLRSRENLVRLLPSVTELVLYDNSDDADPKLGIEPKTRLIIRIRAGTVLEACDVAEVPEWAKPVFVAALKLYL